jgi:AcrR family transcriptional regulator
MISRKSGLQSMNHNLDKGAAEQQAKESLFSAAVTLFAEKGYASTSVREIVASVGVTKPVLYYYFESKEGLFRSILDWAGKQQEILLKNVLDTPGTALQRMIYLYRLLFQGVSENGNLFKLIHNLIFGPPQGAPPYDVEQYHRRMVDAIKAIYLRGLSEGELKDADPDEVAILLLGVTDLSFHLYHIHPESFDPAQPERLLELAFQGLSERKEEKLPSPGGRNWRREPSDA